MNPAILFKFMDPVILFIALLYILLGIISGLLSSFIAGQKGFSKSAWFFIGFFLDIFGLIASAGLPRKIKEQPNVLKKKCSKCAEKVKSEAIVCKYCGNTFEDKEIIPDLINIVKSDE